MAACAPPEVVQGDDARVPHMMWAMWDEDANGVDAHIGFWRTSDGRLALQSIQSNAEVRGRDMLKWLGFHGLPIHVVDAIPEAFGFWQAMASEGLVAAWDVADGRCSPLERLARPFGEIADGAARGTGPCIHELEGPGA